MEQAVSSKSGQKYAQIKHCLQAKAVQNKYVWILMRENNRAFTFVESIMDYDMLFWPEAMV